MADMPKDPKIGKCDYKRCNWPEARYYLILADEDKRWTLWNDLDLKIMAICDGDPIALKTSWMKVPNGIMDKLRMDYEFEESSHVRNSGRLVEYTVGGK